MASNHPTIPQINLLPDIKISLIKARMQRNIMISVSILITVICGTIMFILTSTLTTLAVVKTVADGNIKNYSNKITKEQRTGELNEYMTIQNQLEQISKLKKTQENYTLVFDYLSKLNPTGVNSMTISTFRISGLVQSKAYGNAPGTITLQAKTSGYSALNVIKLTMQKAKIHYHLNKDDKEHVEPIFKDVKLSGVSVSADYSGKSNGDDNGRLSFTLTLKYNPIIFAYNISNTSVEVPNETISDSRDNTPGVDKKLFDGKVNNKPNDNNASKKPKLDSHKKTSDDKSSGTKASDTKTSDSKSNSSDSQNKTNDGGDK